MNFFRYPGSKFKFCHQIIEKINPNLNYCEPFFGAGSLGLKLIEQKPQKSIWINDKDPGIYAIWHSVINNPEPFKKIINEFTPTIENFYKFKEDLIDEKNTDTIEFAFKKIVIHQISFCGLGTRSGSPTGCGKRKSRFPVNCRWSAKTLCKNIDTFHKSINKIPNKCTNLDFSQLMEGNDNFLYLDPPYYHRGSHLYQYFFSVEDHIRLAEYLKTTKNKWLLSYDDCIEVRHLYSWAKLEKILVQYNLNSPFDQLKGQKVHLHKPELLITKE